uniref:Uncharacterized protein n=1 Tax=Sparus aurata TaxID=8175 RepID=A0A671XKH2_SPAAU
MNTTEPGSNFTFTSNTENVTLSNLTTTISQPPSYSSDNYDPEFTIMVVLGLSLLLAGLAAFLAVCRPSEQDGDSEASCGPGESLTRGRSQSSEPQLKVWKRLGSYRRSYNLSFRRPPHRRYRALFYSTISWWSQNLMSYQYRQYVYNLSQKETPLFLILCVL